VSTVTTPLAGDAGANGAPPGESDDANFSPPVSGTVESYDATAKKLSVKGADGKSQSFDATNARITKTEKITLDDLSKLAANNGVVQVTGEKGSDGSYNATRITVSDPTAFGGPNNAPGGNGPNGGNAPGGNRGQNPNGSNAPSGNRGQNPNGGTPRANFTPPTGGAGRLGEGRANGVTVRGGVLSGNKLTGTDFAGQPITVNLSDSTSLLKRVVGTLADLKAGQQVSVNYRAAQGNTPASAMAITIE
jgi:hypothetical protein